MGPFVKVQIHVESRAQSSTPPPRGGPNGGQRRQGDKVDVNEIFRTREEGLIKKLNDKDIYGSLSFLLPHILQIQL